MSTAIHPVFGFITNIQQIVKSRLARTYDDVYINLMDSLSPAQEWIGGGEIVVGRKNKT